MRTGTIVCAVIALTVLFGSMPLASAHPLAQPNQHSSGARLSVATQAPPSEAELEQFRQDMVQMLRDLDQQVTRFNGNPLVDKANGGRGRYNSQVSVNAQQLLQEMTTEQLTLVYQGFTADYPDWKDAPKVIGRLADKVNGPPDQGDIGIQAITPDNCAEAFAAAPSWTDWSIAKSSAIAAQAVYEGIPEPFNAIALAAWAPIEIGVGIAEFYNVLFERCAGDQADTDILAAIEGVNNQFAVVIENNEQNTSAILNSLTNVQNQIISNDNTNMATIMDNDDTNTTTLNTAITNAQTSINNNVDASSAEVISAVTSAQTSINNNVDASSAEVISAVTSAQTEITNNDDANTSTLSTSISNAKTEIINNANANTKELKDLLLRTQIEADLAEPDSATPVALYLTPTAQGGYLDYVQTIVTETLANIQAAGGNTGTAQLFLNQANAAKNDGKFKDAYASYRRAYKMAANS